MPKDLIDVRGAIIAMSDNGWMNNSITEDFLNKCVGKFSFNKRLLVWDSFRCHVSDSTKSVYNVLNIDSAIIPGGCTDLIQAPDVSWNRPFEVF